MSERGGPTETPWEFNSTVFILHGKVDGTDVRCLYAETVDGIPVRIPSGAEEEAKAALVRTAQEIWARP